MQDRLWRYRGPVVLGAAALVVLGAAALVVLALLRLAETPAPAPTPVPRATPPAPPGEGGLSATGRVAGDGVSAAGRVTGADGRAVAGATVCLHCDAPECPRGARGVPRCTTPGAGGEWRVTPLAPTLYWVTATAAAHVPCRWDPGHGRRRLDLRAGPRGGLALVLEPGGAGLTATVVDPSGAPIAGAVVSALVDRHRGIAGTRTVSGPRGKAFLWLNEGDNHIEFRASGYATRVVSATTPGALEIVLRPGAILRGRVTDAESDAPLAGAHVGVSDDSFGVWRRHRATAVTDASGHYEARGLAPGVYTPYASTTGWYGEGEAVTVGPLQSANAPIAAHRAHTVSGQVLVDDRPCAHGDLRLIRAADGSEIEGRLGRDGRVTLSPVRPGVYHALATCHGATAPVGPETIRVTRDDVSGQVWRARRGTAVRGIVVTGAGEPIANLRIVARQGNLRAPTRTRADGTFVISALEPGPVELHAEVLGTAIAETVAAGEGPVRLVASAPGGLSVRVVDDEAGEPLAGFDVAVAGAERTLVVNTGANGRVTLPRLAPGDYTVTVAHPVGGRELRERWILGGAQRQVTVTEGGRVTLAVRVQGLVGRIDGAVVDGEGGPAAGATVTPRYRGAGWEQPEEHLRMFAAHHPWRVPTDAAGSFALTRLIPGSYDLCAAHPSGGFGCVEAVGTRGRTTIVLEPPGSIRGAAVDGAGHTPSDLTVSARELERGWQRSQRFLDRDGFHLTHLPAGTWEITAESSAGTGRAIVAVAAGEHRSEVTVRLRGRVTVTGRVETFAGAEPLAGVQVSLWPDIASRVNVLRGVTDGSGRFAVRGVPAGRAELRVRPPAGYVEFFGRTVWIAADGELGATRLVRDPGGGRGMYGFLPDWPPAGDQVEALRVRIADVKPDSPAGLAGLRVGDTVVAINGVSVAGADHYLFWGLVAAAPGTTSTLTLGDGRELTMVAVDHAWP